MNANFEKLPNFFQIMIVGVSIGIMLAGLAAYLMRFYSVILK